MMEGVPLLGRPVRGSVAYSLMPVEPRPRAAGHMRYPVEDTTPFLARAYAKWFLRHCPAVPGDVAESAVLVVSELAGNAYAAASELPDPAVIDLSLRLFPGHLLIEVIDASPLPPVLSPPGTSEESGRGLLVVDFLASEWGYFMHRGRKVVYCILPVPASTRPGAEDAGV